MNDDLSLYAAGGNKILRHMERLTAKQEKVADQQQEMIDEKVREKAQSVSNIKRIAESQGGTSLTTTNIVQLIDTLTKNVTSRVNQLTQAAENGIGPIDEKLKSINDLISSTFEGDIDKGFELIEKLEKVGVDINKFGEKTAREMQKLFTLNANRKDNNAEEKRIKEEKVTELKQEREILRERGINTYVNEKTLKLEIKSKKEERLELKRLQDEEKKLKQEEKDLAKELKELKKADTIDKEEQEKILLKQENLSEKKKLFERDKERAGLKPGQRVSGMLDQTVGEAFRQIKSLGPEIVQLGGDLLKGFGKLAGVVGKVALGFLALLKPLIPYVLIAVAIGVVLFALYKIIKTVIDLISSAINYVKDKLSFIFGDDEKAKTDPQTGQGKSQSLDETGSYGSVAEERGRISGVTGDDMSAGEAGDMRGESYMKNEKDKYDPSNFRFMSDSELAPKRSKMSAIEKFKETQNSLAGDLKANPGARENLNRLSIENQAMNESKPTNNTVIAPNNVTNSSVNSSTQVSSMEPTNFDRSFINLNTVPV